MEEKVQPGREHRPLSYEDLRRFLLLVVSLLLLAVLASSLARILLLFVVVFFLAMILNPLVVWLQQRGLKRGLAVVLIVLLLLTMVGVVISLMVPPILEQVNQLIGNAPTYWSRIRSQLEQISARYPALDSALPEAENLGKTIGAQASGAATWLLRRTFGVLGGIFLAIIALLLLIFTLTNPRPLISGLLSAVPERHRDAAGRSLARLMQQMTVWTKATLINGAITGISTGLMLHFIGVQPALLFGTLAFFGEFVPNIGPVAMSLPALFVALGMSPGTFLAALAVILFVQQVESNILVPYIMGRQMELHPVTIVFFALAMATLFDAVGAILAVPAAATMKILFEEFYLRPQDVPVAEIQSRTDVLIADRAWPEGELAGETAVDNQAL